jgi:hypothetical protein
MVGHGRMWLTRLDIVEIWLDIVEYAWIWLDGYGETVRTSLDMVENGSKKLNA